MGEDGGRWGKIGEDGGRWGKDGERLRGGKGKDRERTEG